MKMHFITGLPRSGSTLLASILRQNPRFYASVQSPVGQIVTDMLSGMGPRNESSIFLATGQRERMLRAAVDAYYTSAVDFLGPVEVAFDNNRRWTAHMALLERLYPDSVVIACVRDPRAIVDSFETLFQKNPATPSVVYGGHANTTVYERVTEIMKPTGVLGFSLDAFRTAFYGPGSRRLFVLEYDQLAQFPAAVMQEVYEVLNEDPFNHDFERIMPIPDTQEFDRSLCTPGLHDLKPTVKYEQRPSILPPDLLSALPKPFWRAND